MIQLVQSSIIIAFEAVCFKTLADSFLHKRDFIRRRIQGLSVLSIMSVILLFTYVFAEHLVIKSLMIMFILPILFKFYYNAKWIQCIYISIAAYGMDFGIDYLYAVLMKYLLADKQFLLNDPAFSTQVVLLSKLSLFLIILIIRKIWRRTDNLGLLSYKEWICLSYFPAFTIVTLLLRIHNQQKGDATGNYLLVAIGLVIMNPILFYLIRDLTDKDLINQRSQAAREKAEEQLKSYSFIKEEYERQRKYLHDYKNQIACIQGMLTENKIRETIGLLSSLTDHIGRDLQVIHTNHPVIDTIINQKYRYASERGIHLSVIVNDLSAVKLTEDDLVVLLANLLDNAIEACMQVGGNKIIKLKIVLEEEELLISVRNPMNTQALNVGEGRLKSTKEDKRLHGIGLHNIKEVMNRYGGNYVINCENGYFLFSAIITGIGN